MSRPLVSERGFTLLEMLLALVLLAGAGFTLLVKLPVRIEERNLSLAGTQLVQELRDVRQMAMAENTWYDVKFYQEARVYKVTQGITVVRSVTLPEKVFFENKPSTIRFIATGRPIYTSTESNAGTISISNGKQRSDITVAMNTGRVRIENK